MSDCEASQFQCKIGACVSLSDVCDTEGDCTDNSDDVLIVFQITSRLSSSVRQVRVFPSLTFVTLRTTAQITVMMYLLCFRLRGVSVPV